MKKIIISRTDSLGDVVLTLPMAGLIKKHFPDSKIIFLGTKYTRPLIEACEHIDTFLDVEELVRSSQFTDRSQKLKEFNADIILHVYPVKEISRLAKKAGIPMRIATSHRWFTWIYCNKLLHFSRKNSDLHEAQLNLKLLEPLGIKSDLSLSAIPLYYGLKKLTSSPTHQLTSSPPRHLAASPLTPLLLERGTRTAVILHPKSRGNGREWGLDNFSRLIELLPADKYDIYITGTKEEGDQMKNFLDENREKVTDLTGKLNLSEFIGFINSCDALVASGTGPLHIAAALGKRAIGLFPPLRPIHPGRWAPLGKNAAFLVFDKECSKCRHSVDCECIRSIMPEDVIGKLNY